ncbi:MAG: carboxypeptidase-like regulatory domain-containing protein [Pseudomonadota bacterium]
MKENLIFLHDGDIFVDKTVAEEIFGVPLSINRSLGTIHVALPANMIAGPLPLASNINSPQAEKSEDLQPLILQLVINGKALDDVIEGEQKGNKVYFPLAQFASTLEFPITVDAAAVSAKGWFIKEDNKFSLNGSKVNVKGTAETVSSDAVFVANQTLFIDSDLLQRWFQLTFSIDHSNMILNITSKEPLPFEEKLKRQEAHQNLKKSSQLKQETAYKTIDYPYTAASWPFVDLTFGPSYATKDRESHASFSVLASGDLGYMTSHFYAAGDLSHDALSDLRLSLGRDSPSGNLLGPAKATSFLMGDIDSASLPLVAQSSLGRGFTMTNRALDRADTFDSTSFTGDAKPGWDIELYRNGTLIDFQTVGSNGRYEFRNVPILFGNNTFRLMLTGPEGQIEEIVKNINAASALLEEGEKTYNFSVDEKSESLFDISDDYASHPYGLRGVGEVEYGITRYITAAAGAAHTVIQDGEHNYATAGLRGSILGTLASVDTAYDETNNGTSTRLAMFANYFDTDLRFQQSFANGFVSEVEDFVNPTVLATEIGANRQFDLPGIGDVYADASYTYRERESDLRENLWRQRFTKSLYGMSFTNALTYKYDSLDYEELSGDFSIHGFYGRVLLSAFLDYNITPEVEIQRLKLSGNYPIKTNVRGTTTLYKELANDQRLILEDIVTFDVKGYKLSLIGRMDDNNDYFAGVGFNTAFGYIPQSKSWLMSGKSLAETGTIGIRPYLDRNYNRTRDPNEEILNDIIFNVGSYHEKASGDLALATGLPVNIPVSVKLDQNDKDSPFLTASAEEYRVVPRPGTPLLIDYPLFETSEIEGTVHTPDNIRMSGFEVELVNGKGEVVKTANVKFDGYYQIQGVMPDAYTVRVKKEILVTRNLKEKDVENKIVVKSADFFTHDIDLVHL